MDPAEPIVRHDPEARRYEVLLGDEVVGYAEHESFAEGVEAFTHTLVEPAHEGKGLASVLVQAAMDDVRVRGVRVLPSCWYVARWIERHPDYRDLLAEPAG